jgi:murein DD-endopeptidase MepM/ murein hydrolase activator NlpD
VSDPIDAVIARARAAADDTSSASTTTAADRLKLERLASEFESMLLNQMLSEMRKTAHWKDGDAEEEDTFGAHALFESLDAEFAKVMSRAQGLGLSRQLMTAFDRMQGTTTGDDATPSATIGTIGATGTAGTIPAIGTTAIEEPTGSSSALRATEDKDTLDPVAVARQILDGGTAVSEGKSEITSGFGWRRDPFTGETKFHKGVDLRAAYGQDVTATAGGTVTFSGTQGSYGTTVVIEHANGTRSRYAHLSLALVAAGDTIAPGQLVGRAGSTGRATGPHVHLEVVDQNGRPLDPLTHPESGD